MRHPSEKHAQKKSGRLLSGLLFIFVFMIAVFFAGKACAENIQLAWNAESGVAGYKVYYGTTSHNYTSSVDVGNQTSYTLMGLVDGTTYYIALTAYNSSGVESGYSSEVATGGVQTSASASGASGSGGGGGCFIATAAYGSYLAPEVRVLRDFRDRYLIPNYIGSHLVSLYYAVSPPVADFISRHDTLRSLTRWYLTPIVYSIKYSKMFLVMMITAVFIPVVYARILRVQRKRHAA